MRDFSRKLTLFHQLVSDKKRLKRVQNALRKNGKKAVAADLQIFGDLATKGKIALFAKLFRARQKITPSSIKTVSFKIPQTDIFGADNCWNKLIETRLLPLLQKDAL